MDPRFTDLKSTTFSGRRLTRRQIADIQKTVALFPNHSRNELAKTLCEHLNWVSAKGDYRVGACMKLLEALERHGILTLPPKREAQVRDMTSGPVWTSASDRRPALCADLSDLRPLRLEPVTDTDGRQLWNAFVDRHHYLGYRRPFGAHIRYFVADREGRKLGCLLFEAATKTLPCRDNWIGWSDRARGRSRHLMVVNSRFLVFPWVRSKNLASSALALATRRLADDWQRLHGYRPVLCETFVDETRFRASCYRAANWERIGSTGGQSVKGVYVLPLCGGAREILRGERDAGTPAKPPTRAERGRSAASDRRFSRRWETLVAAATAVAEREDARWQKRRRVFNSLLIMLFVLRLVVAPRRQGYRATLCELWEQCAAAGVKLPQDEPPAASTACEAREKLDESAFRALHREILANSPDGRLWKDHRVLAVDGSKIQMSGPRALIEGVFGGRFPRDFGELGGILGVDTAAEMGRTVLNPISGSEVPMNTLPMRPTEAVQIGNSCFSFVKRDGRVEYFSNLEPFDFHADDQREARLLRIAKFAESGVRRSDLVEALGVSRSTVQRAVNQLRRDGEASFFAPRRGRGPSVIDAAMARTVNRLLVSGLSGAAVAREVGISSQTLNNNRRAGGVGGGKPARAAKADPDPEAPAEREAPQDAPERDALEPPIDRSARDARDRAAPMGRGARDTTGRMLAATGHLSETRPQFAEPLSAVAGGGGGG